MLELRLRQLRDAQALAASLITEHRKQCHGCNQALAAHRPERCCDYGWALAKRLQRASHQLHEYQDDLDASRSRQLALFDG